MENKDTHKWVCPSSKKTYRGVHINGKGASEAAKFSNIHKCEFNDFELISGYEDCIDLVRGRDITFNRGKLTSIGNKQGVTVKGGFKNLIFNDVEFLGKPSIAHVVVGQYCDYNLCGIPNTSDIYFNNCTFEEGVPAVQVWWGKNIYFVDCKENPKDQIVHPLIVWAYYTFRKIQQRIKYGKNGRGDACTRV